MLQCWPQARSCTASWRKVRSCVAMLALDCMNLLLGNHACTKVCHSRWVKLLAAVGRRESAVRSPASRPHGIVGQLRWGASSCAAAAGAAARRSRPQARSCTASWSKVRSCVVMLACDCSNLLLAKGTVQLVSQACHGRWLKLMAAVGME
jgi:hypothetical protein